jgi:hypothetical protein
MTIKTRIHRALATAGLLVSLAAAMAVFAPAASASEYCGAVLNGGAQCSGAERLLTGVTGNGRDHAVCVWADALGQGCSSGPGGVASANYGFAAVRTPKIRNLGAEINLVHGETF